MLFPKILAYCLSGKLAALDETVWKQRELPKSCEKKFKIKKRKAKNNVWQPGASSVHNKMHGKDKRYVEVTIEDGDKIWERSTSHASFGGGGGVGQPPSPADVDFLLVIVHAVHFPPS